MGRINRYSQTNNYVEPDDLSIDSALKVAQAAARMGGKIVRQRFGKTASISWKSDIEVQTEVDIEAEQVITAFIKDHFSKHSILGEECGMRWGHSPYTWIIDPLDGTNNFVLNIPQFAICVSLKKHDDVLFTVIHQPMLDITYTALKGKGAYLNNEQIRLQELETPLHKSTVCSILAYSVHSNSVTHSIFSRLYKGTRRLLDTWAPSLDWCMLAAGKIDALVYLSDESLWDDPGMLAGAFLFLEAHGLIDDLSLRGAGEAINALRDTSIIAASSNHMIDQVNELIDSAPLVEEELV
ncbi:MAG TPA: inositol monophosphatase [Ktedonobacteraceae bacterium]|nr:inositol monophosphatase [Ktedonobacteraceae bacterium]